MREKCAAEKGELKTEPSSYKFKATIRILFTDAAGKTVAEETAHSLHTEEPDGEKMLHRFQRLTPYHFDPDGEDVIKAEYFDQGASGKFTTKTRGVITGKKTIEVIPLQYWDVRCLSLTTKPIITNFEGVELNGDHGTQCPSAEKGFRIRCLTPRGKS